MDGGDTFVPVWPRVLALKEDRFLPTFEAGATLTTNALRSWSGPSGVQLRTLKVTKYQQYFFDNSQGLTNSRAAFP
jgi:hypothetical protein